MLRRTLLSICLLGIVATVATPFGIWIWLHRSERTLHGLRVAGEPVPSVADPVAVLRPRADRWLDTRVAIAAGNAQIVATRRELGARIDVRTVATRLRSYARTGNPIEDLRRWNDASRGLVDLPWPISFDAAAGQAFVESVRRDVDREPRAARFDLRSRIAEPHRDGTALQTDAALAELRRVVRSGSLDATFPVSIIETRPEERLPEGVSLEAVLGTFETRFRESGNARGRAHNVRLAAQRLDGAIIPAGSLFSFNERVGERSASAGYRFAHVILDGEMVDGVGGGTCQVASTVHAASFFAGLEVVEHTPHSRPSGYIPMGLDATVVWPRVDLKVRNPFTFPIVVHAVAENGRLRVEMYGPRRPVRVGFERVIVARSDFEERVVLEPGLPTGARFVTQEGLPGYTVARTRLLQRDRGTVHEDRMITYPPTDRIVRVGTGPAVAPETDLSPYFARFRRPDPIPTTGELAEAPREVVAIAR